MRVFEKVSYDQTGTLPTRADDRSAGHDFYTPITVTIPAHKSVAIKTNIKCQMEDDDVLLIFVRSSIGIKKHLMLANQTGVIDASYYNNPDNEGNIICCLYNYGEEEITICGGERIAQGVFVKYLKTDEGEVLSNARTGGIGSSGA